MLDAVGRYAMPPEAEARAGIDAMRGDIALYRGHYAAAEQAYLRLGDVEGGVMSGNGSRS